MLVSDPNFRMLSYVWSIPSKVGGFLKRNKFRLSASLVVGAGVYYYYGSTIRQALEMYKLMQAMNQGEEQKKSPTANHHTPTEMLNLSQTVATGDETAEKVLVPSIRAHVGEIYSGPMTRLQMSLTGGLSAEDRSKEDLFNDYHLLCFSRLVVSVVATTTAQLVSRMCVCLIGRANRRDILDEDQLSEHRALLGSLRRVSAITFCQKLDSMAKETVRVEFDNNLFFPANSVSKKALPEMTPAIVKRLWDLIEKQNNKGWAWVLSSEDAVARTGSIFSQIFDVLDSPQFNAVLRHSVAESLEHAFASAIPKDATNQFSVARMLPGIRIESDAVFTTSIKAIKRSPIVEELCEAVYFAESANDEDDEFNAESMNSPNDMDKLGDLLEKLVKTDINKNSFTISMFGRLLNCTNCYNKLTTAQSMTLWLKHKVPNADRRLLQSLTDGFSSFPLKQMKSTASNSAQTPVNRIAQILSKGNIPCPKCNQVHWQ